MLCFKDSVRSLMFLFCLQGYEEQTSVFKVCDSPDLERADFDRESFQSTWLSSYFFSVRIPNTSDKSRT